MSPILARFSLPLVGVVEIPAYFTLLTIGFALAMWLTWRESKRIGLDPEKIIDANLWMIVWGIIGARVLHLIADGHFHEYVNLCVDPKQVPAIDPPVSWCAITAGKDPCGPDFLCDTARHVCYPPRDCLAALEVWRGGLAYYGGFIFALAYGAWFVRRHKMPLGRVADLAAPAISLGLFFGRMGCYLNGCCFGKVTHGPLGIAFPHGSGPWRAQLDQHLISPMQGPSLPVYPTQLGEAFACLAISAFLYLVVRPRKRRDGDVMAGFLILYAIARSFLEAFRDDDRGVFFGNTISTSQILSIPLAALGVLILWYVRRPRPASAAAA